MLIIAKAIFVEYYGYYWVHNRRVKGSSYFSKDTIQIVNVIVWTEYEITYLGIAVEDFNQKIGRTSTIYKTGDIEIH